MGAYIRYLFLFPSLVIFAGCVFPEGLQASGASVVRSLLDNRVIYGSRLARSVPSRVLPQVDLGPRILASMARRHGTYLGEGKWAKAYMMHMPSHPAANGAGELVVKVGKIEFPNSPGGHRAAQSLLQTDLVTQRILQSHGWRVAPLHESRLILESNMYLRAQPYIRGPKMLDLDAGRGMNFMTAEEYGQFEDKVIQAINRTNQIIRNNAIDALDKMDGVEDIARNFDMPVSADLHFGNLIYVPGPPGAAPSVQKNIVIIDW